MTTDDPGTRTGPRLVQTAHLILAALAAVAVAVASQGWPVSDPDCDDGSCAVSTMGEGA